MPGPGTKQRYREPVTGLEMEAPAEWRVVQKALPDYAYPYQIAAVSNYEIDVPASRRDVWDPEANEENYPRVAHLPSDAVFIWAYAFNSPEGPTKYPGFRPPLDYDQSETTAFTGDPRWPNAIQRELGFTTGRLVVSFWVWEGLDAEEVTRRDLRELFASIRRN